MLNKIFLIVLFIFSIFYSSTTIAQNRYPRELIFSVTGIGTNEGWTVNYSSMSNPRWIDDNGEKIITNNYLRASISGIGNNKAIKGFDAPDNFDTGVPIAYGEYGFKYKFDGHSNTPLVKLDLYDANWSGGYTGSGDLYIEWRNSENKFYYKNTATNNKYVILGDGSSGQYYRIWTLFNRQTNQQPFILPPPENFLLYNPEEYDHNPQFFWSEFNGSPGFDIKYKIYRSVNQGGYNYVALASPIWTDQEVVIKPIKQGHCFAYYVTAYTINSPESDPSDNVDLWGLFVQKNKQDYAETEKQIAETNQLTSETILSIHPNPFNPATSINYTISTDGHVHISIFNIAGQLIKEFPNGSQQAGNYRIYFDG